jgi:hypothetical protein
MSVGDIAVGAVAVIALGFLALIVLAKVVALIRNWREVVEALGWIAVIVGAGAAGLFGLGVVVVVGVLAYGKVMDQRMMQQCTTLYERQAKGATAPDDYFGRQLRQTIADETKQCAEFAAHKEAAKASEK